MLLFYGCICFTLAFVLIFCDYFRTFTPCLWLTMLERGNCARGCAHFFYLFAVFHSLWDFLFIWLGFRSLFVVSLAIINFPTVLCCLNFFILQRCSTPHWILSRRQTFFCAVCWGMRPTPCLKTEINNGVVRRIDKWDKRKKKYAYCVSVLLLTVPGTLYQYLMTRTKNFYY